jgi:hypothetical protein
MKRGTILIQGVLSGLVVELLGGFSYHAAARLSAIALLAAAVAIWLVNKRHINPWAFSPRNRYYVPASMALLAAVAILPFPHLGALAKEDRPTVVGLLMALAVALGALYLSSLVDRFYVLPRLRGDRGAQLICQQSLGPRWTTLTRVWLLHRMLAMLLLVTGVATAVTLAANRWVEGLNQVVAAAVGAATTVLAGFYVTRIAPVIAQILNPALQLGDKVELAEEFASAATGKKYYVVDVALEGFRLLELDTQDQPAEASTGYRTHDRVLDVSDLRKYLRSRRSFAACPRDPQGNYACKQVNPYCPHNPHVGEFDP